MELDKRIKEGKRPLTCFDLKEAEKFEGKEGYFSDYPRAFADGEASIDQCTTKGILKLDECSDNYPYINKTTCLNYPYFLPVEWVKEPEKKYRPFTLAEWIDQHEIGEVIHYRNKSEGIEFRLMYMGYAHGIGKNIKDVGVGAVTLGLASYTLDYFFDYYEIEMNGEWKPFGIEVEDVD